MTKKILLALFVMCLSFAGFAQDLNEVKKDVVKNVTGNKQNDEKVVEMGAKSKKW